MCLNFPNSGGDSNQLLINLLYELSAILKHTYISNNNLDNAF